MTNQSSGRNLTSQAIINGHKIPILTWTCNLTGYGNLNTFEVTTSIKQLKTLGYDIFADASKNPTLECQIILIDNTEGSSQIVFDGIVDRVEGLWEDDLLEINGRDFSAVLRDKTQSLDNYVNQPISAIVQDIAQQSGLQSFVQSTDQIAGIKASTFQGEEWSYSTSPQSLWNIVQQLADEVGYIAYVDQHKVLHFLPEGQGPSTHQYYWRPKIGANVKTLSILKQARRCENFTLHLHGYDRDGKETIVTDYVQGTGQGLFLSRRRPDVNAQNIDQVAKSIAESIARRNVVVKMVVEGNTDLNVNDQLKVLESESGDLLGMSNTQLFIVGLTHSFSMPDYPSNDGDGFYSHITANQLTNIQTNT